MEKKKEATTWVHEWLTEGHVEARWQLNAEDTGFLGPVLCVGYCVTYASHMKSVG